LPGLVGAGESACILHEFLWLTISVAR